ncbi:MAG: exodeoxyribonuclease III [bacterium]
MKIVSFNVNGIRARLHQLKAVIDSHSPAVIGLQETKVSDEEFPIDDIRALGYDASWYGQKGHYGVALLHNIPLINAGKGLPEYDNEQKRLIMGTFESPDGSLHIVNGYFPQGENRAHPTKFPNKQSFYRSLKAFLVTQFDKTDRFLVIGDMNIAPEDVDIGIGEQNKKRWLREGKCCFLPEERTLLDDLMGVGLKDSFRLIHGNKPEQYSWFDYRSRGFERDPVRGLRIDLILASDALSSSVKDAGVDYAIRGMEKPSDHCPVWVEI